MFATAPTWGIAGPDFLWAYGSLTVAAALLVLWRWRHELGPRPRTADAKLGVAQLALLAGGPQLAITATATKLHDAGNLVAGDRPRTIAVGRRLTSAAGPLERAIVEAVARDPGVTSQTLRAQLVESDAIAAMTAQLTRYELVLDPAAIRRLRRLWLVGLAVAIVGAVRIAAGIGNHAAVGYLTVFELGVVAATVWLALQRPWTTARGAALLAKERRGRRRRVARPELPLAVALFGGAALWSADPSLAKAWSVTRASTGAGLGAAAGTGGSSGSCSSGGCGGGGGGGCGGGGGGGCGG
jgi:uncharacterized protein (TIGR04222 family)